MEEFCHEQGDEYVGSDMTILGNIAAITGQTNNGGSTLPFVIMYDYRSKFLQCIQKIYIGADLPQVKTIEYLGGNLFGIAGLLGHDAFYLPVRTDCSPLDKAKRKNIDNRGQSMDVPAKIVQKSGTSYVIGYTCDNEQHKAFIWNPKSQASFLFDLNQKGSKVFDASLSADDHFIIAGATNLNDDGSWDEVNYSQGFLMKVDTLEIDWAKSYTSDFFQVSHLQQIEVESDGGILGVGWQMPLDTNTSEFNVSYYSDTWILKTDSEGRLYDCDCYYDINVTPEEISPAGEEPITDPVDVTCDPRGRSYDYIDLEIEEFVCDRYCPDDCCEDPCADSLIIANPRLNPGYYVVDEMIKITGKSGDQGDSFRLSSGGTIEFLAGFEISHGNLLEAINEECEECCEMEDPMTDLPWMSNMPGIDDADIVRIFFADGSCMYEIKPCDSDIKHYFDCDGHFLCESGLGSANDCPNWNFQNGIQLIQSCP